MIEFWLAAGLLLLIALGFLLIPVLRERRAQQEEDRTALNVALYEERVAELQEQQTDGVLSRSQLDSAQAEAARELLADTDGTQPKVDKRLGKTAPAVIALLVPVLAMAMYLHFGASDKVELTSELAKPPTSVEEMTQRLERVVAAQPDSAQGLFFLGRAYMSQNRPADAARIFERTAAVAGREPQLLGQWAQALYFAAGKQWSAQIQALTDEALKADPKEVTSLGLLGISAFEGKRYQDAIDYWQRLLVQLPADDGSRAPLQGGIDQAKARLLASGGQVTASSEAAKAPATVGIKVRVELGEALKAKVQAGDTVFVFARATNGPPIPLAVKRLTVADLPVTVELADADAMRPDLKLSSYPEVQLMARVSRAGQPVKGEWIGRGAPLASDTTAMQHLTIDTPDL
ncbi:c-type cytochrome biogenesis protein CcmI [Pseudomonas sp. MWU16-30317]|uniref:c-type cytochrome biogenesis protein CcmI n=1 Tax=Pseudomonas sp. MWU16-30317 TaxID=2878095 RepID=UPI001CFB508A|nr:c-type cytochrome biogenesis protein CcmI [Pseudomonas sp. MWU16-30317]